MPKSVIQRKEAGAQASASSHEHETSALRGMDYAQQMAHLSPIQARGGLLDDPVDAQGVASRGIAGQGGQLPHAAQIQQSFGHHDVSGIRAHVGGDAARAANTLGASAYATQGQVAFANSPDLHTAAHEAAHVFQQQAGVQLKGGLGVEGDRHEQHADAVADAVVAGRSAAPLLDQYTGGKGGAPDVSGGGVQLKTSHADKMNAGQASSIQTLGDKYQRMLEVALAEVAAEQLGTMRGTVKRSAKGTIETRMKASGSDAQQEDALEYADDHAEAAAIHAFDAVSKELAQTTATGFKTKVEAKVTAAFGAAKGPKLLQLGSAQSKAKKEVAALYKAELQRLTAKVQLEVQKTAVYRTKLEDAANTKGTELGNKELGDRKKGTNETAVNGAVTAVKPALVKKAQDSLDAYLKDKLGADGVGMTRSKKLKAFHKSMMDKAKAQAHADAKNNVSDVNDKQLVEDAQKRSEKGLEGSVKGALEDLAKTGRQAAMTDAQVVAKLTTAIRKAAWGHVRAHEGDKAGAIKAAKAAGKTSLETLLAAATAKAKAWRTKYVATASPEHTQAETLVATKVQTGDKLGKKAADQSNPLVRRVDRIADAMVPSRQKTIEQATEKYLRGKIGVGHVRRWRSPELKAWRAKMKDEARTQAYDDIQGIVDNPSTASDAKLKQKLGEQGDATKRYVRLNAKKRAYSKAKGSVDGAMKDIAHTGAVKSLIDAKTKDELRGIARKAAFTAIRGKANARAVRAATGRALSSKMKAVEGKAVKQAQRWKNELIGKVSKADLVSKTEAPTGVTSEADAKTKTKDKTKADKVGEKAVTASLKAATVGEGFGLIGKLCDVTVPNRGDSCSVSVELQIPIPETPAFLLIKVSGSAERGVTNRKLDGDNMAEASSLAFETEVAFGAGVDLWGLKADGSIGFFVRAQAMSTDKTMKAISYGGYRSACRLNNNLANFWATGRNSKAAKKARQHEGANNADYDGSRTLEAEMWAAMIEEQVFLRKKKITPAMRTVLDKKHRGQPLTPADKRKIKGLIQEKFAVDEDAFVELGGSLEARAAFNAQVLEGEVALRGELADRYDGDVIKGALGKRKQLAKNGAHNANIAIAKAGNTKADALARRKLIKPKKQGGISLATSLTAKFGEQAVMFEGEFAGGSDGWSLNIGAGLSFTSGEDITSADRISSIVRSSASIIKNIKGFAKTHKKNNSKGATVTGGVLDGLTQAGDVANAGMGDAIGKAMTGAVEVDALKSDQVNETMAKSLGVKNVDANEAKKGALNRQTTIKLNLEFSGDGQGGFDFSISISDVKTQEFTAKLGPAELNASIEKSTRLAKLAYEDGKFQGEFLGMGNGRKLK